MALTIPSHDSYMGIPPPVHRRWRVYEQMSYLKTKERKLKKLIQMMADKVRLPAHQTKVCQEEASILHRKGELEYKLTNTAAGLVFIGLQRQIHTASFKEVANLLGINFKILGRTVKKLKMNPVVNRPSLPVLDEDKMQAVLDKMDKLYTPEVKKEARQLALGLKAMCSSLKVQGHFTCQNATADCALLVIALESIWKKKLTIHWLKHFSEQMTIKEETLQTRVWQLKKALVHHSKEIPTLGALVDSRQLSTHNVHQYVSTIVKYKDFILINPDKESDADAMGSGYCKSAAGPSGVCSAALLVNQPSDLTVDSSGDSDDLSDIKDADIANYIASSKEVAEKKLLSSSP